MNIQAPIFYSYTSGNYTVALKDDRTGAIFAHDNQFDDQGTFVPMDLDDNANGHLWILGEFAHTENLDDLLKMDESDRHQYMNDRLWESWNDQLGWEALIPPGGLQDEPISFTRGTAEDFGEVIKAVILTDPEPGELGDFYIYSSVSDDVVNDDAELSERARNLISGPVMNHFDFDGHTWEYCDQNDDQRSGYGQSPDALYFDGAKILSESSARERGEARLFLKAWLKERGVDPAEYFEAGEQVEADEETG